MRLTACSLVLLTLISYAITQDDRQSHNVQQFKHIVILFQENRSTDNMFHDPILMQNGADIAKTGLNSKGQEIPLTPLRLANEYDLGHAHLGFITMYDNGKMDGADKVSVNCPNHQKGCPPPNPQYKYVRGQDMQPYFQLAEKYTFGDRMFQTNQGASFPAHQFIIAGTSAPTADSDLFAAENPLGIPNPNADTGCKAPSQEWVWLIDPAGNESSKQYPCFEHPTLTDLLDNAGLSWRYYTPQPNHIWSGPNAIKHIRLGKDWKYLIPNPKQIFTDISNDRLPAVSWVVPPGQSSDHPVGNDGSGPSWVASIVNAIGKTHYWDNTAIIVTWDDWGGWYDHVAPSIVNSYEYGFRVPLLVIAKNANHGYISHVTHDFGSILKFVESNWDLPSLGYADQNADDLSDCFSSGQQHEFVRIPTPLDENYFLKDKRPMTAPDND
jgi:phospholipase C